MHEKDRRVIYKKRVEEIWDGKQKIQYEMSDI